LAGTASISESFASDWGRSQSFDSDWGKTLRAFLVTRADQWGLFKWLG